MDVNIWSTFKKGGRVASIPNEISTMLPSQRLKLKYEKGFSLINTTKPKPSEQEDIESKIKQVFDILHTFSEINSLPEEDVAEILEVFKTEVFIDENFEYILERARVLSKYGLIPELIEDENVNNLTGGVKYALREKPKQVVPFNIPSPIKRQVTQKVRRIVPKTTKYLTTLKSFPPLPTISREGIETVPERTAQEKERIISSIQDVIFEQQSMSKIVKLVFEELPLNIFTKEQRQTYRSIYEFGDIEAQCNNTIGKFNTVDNAGKRKFPDCYICGVEFYEDKNDGIFLNQEKKTKDELRPTCEHILPIIQAAFFLELYRPSIDKTNPVIKHQLDLEYSWAHRCCNYEKSDISFLGTRVQKGKLVSFSFNHRAVTGVLSSIANTSNTRVGLNVIQTQIHSENTWLSGRKDIIQPMIDNIVDYLNSRGNIGLLFILGYDKIISSERISQKFINAIGEAKQRIQKTKIKLILDKESGKSISGEVPIKVESPYQKSLKRT